MPSKMNKNLSFHDLSTNSLKLRWAFVLFGVASSSARAANYQDTVIGLAPNFYYQLNETDPAAGALDTMGNAPAPGLFNGEYGGGGPIAGGPGALEVFQGIPVPGLGGADNLAHYSNDQGHLTLGDGNLFAASSITVALFLKAGPAQGGDRIFTNNLTDATKSFQVVTANNGLVLSVDPNNAGFEAERTLYLEDNSGPDRRFIDPESGWFHVIASTEGATGAERAENLRVWINGVDRTENLQPDTTGWGTDTGMAKIGGRRSDPTDSTTHSGAQDEVAIWLDRVLTDEEAMALWQAATNEVIVPLEITGIELTESEGESSVSLTWRSKPNRNYLIFSSTDLINWQEITDSYPSEGDTTSFTNTPIPPNPPVLFYKVEEGAP